MIKEEIPILLKTLPGRRKPMKPKIGQYTNPESKIPAIQNNKIRTKGKREK
jgi:hypothetical protein